MRIVTGAISHETSTFTPVRTTRESFWEHFGDVRGKDILRFFRGANIPTGGFIEGAEAHGFDLVPSLYAHPFPSGPAPQSVLDDIVQEMLDAFRAAGRFDGVLLELHGSMTIQGIDDADGYILSAVRRFVGPKVPVVAQLDIHANVSPAMVQMADVLIGRETYPEVDMAARGRECADVLVRILRDGLRPTMALCQVPMTWGLNQVTAHPPMREAIAQLHRIESIPGVVCASISTGYPLADGPDMGASVTVVTDGDRPAAQAHAESLGRWIFERRADWHRSMPSTAEALKQAQATGRYPVIFADWHDNTGGGSPGDSTGMLRVFAQERLEPACLLYIVDPEAIGRCRRAGVGATLTLDVGAKSTPLQGQPVTLTAEVVTLSDGRFRYDGPIYAGLQGNMGPSAHIRQGGLHVLLVSVREQPFDMAFARTLGLDPRTMRYVGLKSSAHFRAAFEPWAGQVHVVAEPSVHSPENVTYRRLGRKVYPIDAI